MNHSRMSDLETERKPSRPLWIFAAIGALAIHLGGAALAFAYLQTGDPESELGGQAIEIGLEMSSPHLEATDLPAGPEAEATAASPALAEQQAVVKETELPKDKPTILTGWWR
jgi:protein TonB